MSNFAIDFAVLVDLLGFTELEVMPYSPQDRDIPVVRPHAAKSCLDMFIDPTAPILMYAKLLINLLE